MFHTTGCHAQCINRGVGWELQIAAQEQAGYQSAAGEAILLCTTGLSWVLLLSLPLTLFLFITVIIFTSIIFTLFQLV